jgi:putative ABC transport system permease protein
VVAEKLNMNANQAATNVDPTKIDAGGKDVLSAVQSVREVLKARGEALEAFRKMLLEQREELEKARADFAAEQNLLCDEFEARGNELAERESALEELEKEATAARHQHEIDVQRVAERQTELEEWSLRLDTRETGLNERERTLDDREMSMSKEFEGVRERIAAIDEERAKIELQVAELEKSRAEFAAKYESFESEKTAHAEAAKSLAAERSEVEQEKGQIEGEREKLRTAHNQLNEKKTEIEKAEAGLDERRKALEVEMQEARAELEATLEEARANSEAELARALAEASEARAAADRERDEAADLKAQWRQKIEEIENAGDTLASLKAQLEEEVGTLADPENDLLGEFELPTSLLSRDGGQPTPVEKQAQAAVDRFQKLCRDARRRAIGLR